MIRSSFACATIALASCGGGTLTLIEPALPDDAVYVAIVATSESGAVVASSGLVRRTPGAGLRAELTRASDESPRTVRVLAWSERRIQRARIAPDTDTSRPLRAAAADEPLVPAPDVVGQGFVEEGGVVHLEAGASLAGVELTAPWVPECPLVASATEAVQLWTTCLPADCRAPVKQQGCKITIENDKCGGQAIEGRIGPRGAFESAVFGACRAVATREGARASTDCTGAVIGGCGVDLLVPPYPERLSVERVKLVDRAPVLQNDISPPTGGMLGGLAVLPDRVVVASHDGRVSSWKCEGQSGMDPARVYFVDPESVRRTGSATVGGCLSFLAPDPRGDGFVAVHGGRMPLLARYDRAGKRVLARPIEAAEVRGSHGPVGLVATGGDLVVAFREAYAEPDDLPGYVVRFAGSDLRALRVSAPLDRHITGVTVLPDGKVMTLGNDDDQLEIVDSATGMLVSVYPMRVVCGLRGFYAGQVAFGTTTPSLLVSNLEYDGSVQALSDAFGERCVSSLFYERDALPYAIIEWPASPGLVLVGLTVRDPTRTAVVALLDPQAGRYLPGAQEIGQGAVATPARDAKGRVWVTLPWEGTVARISPR